MLAVNSVAVRMHADVVILWSICTIYILIVVYSIMYHVYSNIITEYYILKIYKCIHQCHICYSKLIINFKFTASVLLSKNKVPYIRAYRGIYIEFVLTLF